jgi:ParB-like chromosome segregation protein Spo0J
MRNPPACRYPEYAPFAQPAKLADFMGADWRGNLVTLPVGDLASWRLSVGRDEEALKRSIEAIGLARPLWVARSPEGRPVVISGGRRLRALREMGAEAAPCLCPDLPYLGLASIIDNLERGLNPAELALALAMAESLEDPGERRAARALLGVADSDRRLPGLAAALFMPEEAFLAFAAGRLDPEDVEMAGQMPEAVRDGALRLILGAKASRRNRRRWLEWLSDLARIRDAAEGSPLPPKIVDKALLEAARGPDGERAVTERLLAMRLPALSKIRAKRRELVKSMRLPKGLRLDLDPELEDSSMELRLTFVSPSDLRRLAEAALALADSQEMASLWQEPRKWPPE